MMSSPAPDLVSIFESLSDFSGEGERYSARTLDTHPTSWVAKSGEGNPAILFAVTSEGVHGNAASLELPNLTFHPRRTCRVRDAGGIEHFMTLAVLQCTSGDVLLRTYFLRSMSGLLKTLPESPSEAEIGLAVRKLVELFRAMEAPARRSLQGLWCELLLIDRARDVSAAAMAWHADPHDLLDFVAGSQAVEVKSCIGPLRRHHFLLSQVMPPVRSTTIVASFVLDESGSGTSLAHLWDSLAARPELSDDLKERCSQLLAKSLGQDWRKATRVAFDRSLAERNMRLFDVNAIPKVDPRVPIEVTRVEFTSELTNTPFVDASDVARSHGLLSALFARR